MVEVEPHVGQAVRQGLLPDSRTFDGLLVAHTHTYLQCMHTYIHTYMHPKYDTLKATPSLPWSFLLSTRLMKMIPERINRTLIQATPCMRDVCVPDLIRQCCHCICPIFRKYVSPRDRSRIVDLDRSSPPDRTCMHVCIRVFINMD